MAPPDSSQPERIRAAEVIAALSLATDLGVGMDLEHGLRSTLFAVRLGERLGVDSRTLSHTYYASMLLHVGCTAEAHQAPEVFPDFEAFKVSVKPVAFGSPREMMGAVASTVAPGRSPVVRAVGMARTLPAVARRMPGITAAHCEAGRMLSERLGLAPAVAALFAYVDERWDGKGQPGRARRDEIPLPIRIAHVARDADMQLQRGGIEYVAAIIRARSGAAFDPAIAELLADEAADILELDGGASAWEETLDCEPGPRPCLEGEQIDRALGAMGDFADLSSPYLVGHSAGVAELAAAAAERWGLAADDQGLSRRAGLVHDVGRVAVPIHIWQKPGPLSPNDWERVRLHAYHSERILGRSELLASLAPVATSHHERLDGSGYHRGAPAPALAPAARLLAAADAYHAMTEPRPHRDALTPEEAAEVLGAEAREGRLDADAAGAVLEAAGHARPRLERPAGLTEREAQVVGLLARALQTKQIAGVLGISTKTADRHIQNAYAKIGVSTRAGATLFAMEHGLVAWGELPMGRGPVRS
jgi:HD-GYP domain-containing protein (c-di-GMP phosphodiesterase class II)